jgi:hypothetical protein
MSNPAREQLISALLERLEFPPPEPLVGIMLAFVDRAGGLKEGFELFDTYTNTHLGHFFRGRYETMPIEFLPFMDTGGDGCHFGYVVHAPELHSSDYPMGHVCPGESSGIAPVGDSTLAGIENIISYAWTPELSATVDVPWLKELGITPGRFKVELFNPQVLRQVTRPGFDLPPDWKHEITSDGVGVVARREAFGPRPLPDLAERSTDLEFDEWLHRGDAEFEAGCAAAALWYFKELWTWHYFHPRMREIYPRLLNAYRALGKEAIASMCQKSFYWLNE